MAREFKIGRSVTDAEFADAMDAIKGELEYQDGLDRRTSEEAKDPPGFFTLARVYLRRGENAWADTAGNELALHGLRKVAAICVRGMVYCGVRYRDGF